MASPLTLTTPLGPGALLVTGFSGHEELSRPFSFELDLVALNSTSVPFDALIGMPVMLAMAIPGGGTRYFNGFVSRFSAGSRGSTFTRYQAEVVPQLWLLTRNRDSRIFQQRSVPEILQQVLGSRGVTFQLQGTFPPREYCVQYRESDFDFASRLMEEEGIYYFFHHTENGHQMVVANTPSSFQPVVPGTESFASSPPTGPNSTTVYEWSKTQELRSGKVTLWDHHFELPGVNHLEGTADIQDAVRVGSVTHHLALAGNDKMELYDYPGYYAKRYDGVDPGGGSDPDDLSMIQPDATRMADIRMRAEALLSLLVVGASNCRQFITGNTFTLRNHFNGNGKYLLTHVSHAASVSGDPRKATQDNVAYRNSFQCIPAGLPFRPERTTPIPTVRGSQTATVVGPAGSQVFTDQFARVKVQFHWDREGKRDEDSSCWVRVGALHAGTESGFVTAPRIGQEVIVDFLEGDPDQPIIVGSVYNADHRPPPPPPGTEGGGRDG
jgi:type VI secretion system secreted protein VgrG